MKAALAEVGSAGKSSVTVAKPGVNCWQRCRTERAAFLVDAADYYRALRSSIIKAERSVIILGWDIHSKTPLLPGDPTRPAADGWPIRLGDLLLAAVKRKRRLRVRVLSWDFAVVFALDREILPLYRLSWRSHRRLRLVLDADHPPAGSHHQKVVVIDDKVAYCGGIDVTTSRWDTREHPADPAKRLNPDGRLTARSMTCRCWWMEQRPLLWGICAKALATRDRTAVTRVSRPKRSLALGFRARSEERGRGNRAHRSTLQKSSRGAGESKQLYIASIQAAQRFVYMENQYFTSVAVADAIAESLSLPFGPEFVIVLPYTTHAWGGWKKPQWGSRHTPDSASAAGGRSIRAAGCVLSAASRPAARSTLRAFESHGDRQLFRAGGLLPNLSNRSMSLDTECDLVIEAAGREDVKEAVVAFRNGLIAEHSGCTTEEVAKALATCRSAIEAVESLRRPGRSLIPHTNEVSAALETVTPEYSIIGPTSVDSAGEPGCPIAA